MTPVVWTRSALADIDGIRRYIGNFNPRAMIEMAERIIAAGNSLASFPHRGRPVPGTPMRETTLVFPYVIRYRVERNRILILRVRHGARQSSAGG